MRWFLSFFLLFAHVGICYAETCEEVCERYKSFARTAGDPRTLEPLIKLHDACVACVRGPGASVCSSITTPGDGTGVRCDYKPATPDNVKTAPR